MVQIDDLNRIPLLYHFTDRRNVPLIKKMGGLFPLSELLQKQVAIPAPGGNQWSHEADVLKGMDKYVHLCFRNNHPMEFIARQEGRITDTIFLQIHPSVLQLPGVLFTPDVSNKAGVEPVPIGEAAQLIDFPVLYTRTDWADPEIQQRLKQAEKCEILVPAHIPINLIRNIDNG
jgi:ssDNA thymidine ADP-ribosyltransferase, DarT